MQLAKNSTQIYLLLTILLLATLQGCTSVSVEKTCPKIPSLDVREPLGPAFRVRMQDFLQGKLPAQIN